MQLNLHGATDHNAIRRYDEDSITVNETRFDGGVLVMPETTVEAWPVREMVDLTDAVASELLELDPEVVILGTGRKLVFPAPAFMRVFLGRGIGCEVMDTGAACRTYNVLASEGRQVLGAIMPAWVDPESP